MDKANDLLSRIEAARLWNYFHKDWLLQIRLAVRGQLLSPSNKGLGNRLDEQKHLRKRAEYFDAAINLLEVDALTQGNRILPDRLLDLGRFERVAWTAFHDAGLRRFRGWEWNEPDKLPEIAWRIDLAQTVKIDLASTLREAAEFNQWDTLANPNR